MARIPDEVIARVKGEVDVKALVESSGVELERQGGEWVGLCCFHREKTASLFVNPAKGSWHCFGCERGGSVIDFVMERDGVGFREAAERLIAEHLPEVELSPPSPPVPAAERLSDEALDELVAASDAATLGWVAERYHARARSDPRAGEYLASRGLSHPGLVERFRLGFSDRTLGHLFPDKRRKRGAAIRSKLERLGIYRGSGHEHLAGRLVVPLLSLAGEVVQLYGRSVTASLRRGTPDHLYLDAPLDGVLNLPAFVESEELILCEAPLDAFAFYCAGFSNVTTSLGVNGFTPALAEALMRHGTRRLLIAYDRDEAGERAARRLAERLLAAGVECYRVAFPRGMDAAEYALAVQPATRSLDLVLRQAEWMGTGRPPAERSVTTAGPGPGAGRREPEASREAAASSSAASPAASGAASAASASAAQPPAAPSASTAPATLLPAPPAASVPVEVTEREAVVRLGDRRYRARGLERNLSYDVLRVNLLAARGDGFHVDTLDLYSDRQRRSFVKQASLELGIEERLARKDLGRVLLALEALQDEAIARALAPEEAAVEIPAEEREAALELLRDPGLVERILADFERCGVVGEETNKLVGYLTAISRRQERPLAALIQSSSAAGKSALMEAVLSFVPAEERVSYSAMTGQSLFYMGEQDLAHKVLAIAEEEGAERASYALKLLQSEGELSIASTGKDPATGRLVTHEYHVEGPVAILLTTTAIDLDEELLNRCLVLTVDEGREQTRAIHRMQRERETLSGQLALRRREAIRRLHQNAQRLLRPLVVANPFAASLSFPDGCTRTRRDHEKYLGLIRSVALLFQHQRPVETRREGGEEVAYVEVTAADLEIANRLAHEVLGRTLDELPPQTRRLLLLLDGLVGAECGRLGLERPDFRFSRRWLREASGWGDTQLKVHLARLVDLEYLVVHRDGHAQRYLYELLYDGAGADGEPFLPGLIDVAALDRAATTRNRSGSLADRSGGNGNRSAPGRPPVGGWSGGGRAGVFAVDTGDSAEKELEAAQDASPGSADERPSKAHHRRRPVKALGAAEAP